MIPIRSPLIVSKLRLPISSRRLPLLRARFHGNGLSDSWNNSPSEKASKREHRTRRGYLLDQFFNRNFFRFSPHFFASSFFKRDKWRDSPHATFCPNTIPFSIRNNVISLIASFHNLFQNYFDGNSSSFKNGTSLSWSLILRRWIFFYNWMNIN